MDFDQFSRDCMDQWPAFPNSAVVASAPHPTARNLSRLPREVRGMATENKLMLINRAVAHLQPQEVYVEIGCWKGLSLAGAAHGNPDKPIFACDNFSQFGGPRDELNDTVRHFSVPGQVQFFDMDYQRFLEQSPWKPLKVGVYFYDGGHTFAEQFLALKYMLPHLADDALVLVDDSNAGPVRSANRLVAQRVAAFELVLDLRTPRNGHPTWWNGMQVFRYRKARATGSADVSSVGFWSRCIWWDHLVAPLQRACHRCRALLLRCPYVRHLKNRFRPGG